MVRGRVIHYAYESPHYPCTCTRIVEGGVQVALSNKISQVSSIIDEQGRKIRHDAAC